MKRVTLSLAVSSTLLSLSATANPPPIDAIFAGAAVCMDTINVQSLAAQAEQGEGEIRLYGEPYVHSIETRTDTSYAQDAKIRYVPAIESTYFDGNVPGSAWRQCMQEKGLPLPAETVE